MGDIVAPNERGLPTPKRPIVITVICLFLAFGFLVTLPVIFLKQTHAIAAWYPVFLCLSLIVGVATMIGLWKMRRWAVVLYVTFFVLSQFILLTSGLERLNAMTAIPLVVIGIAFIYWPKMR